MPGKDLLCNMRLKTRVHDAEHYAELYRACKPGTVDVSSEMPASHFAVALEAEPGFRANKALSRSSREHGYAKGAP